MPDVSPAIRQVTSSEEFRQLRDLFEQYEADLPASLRHGAVPNVDDLTQIFVGRNAAFLASIAGDDVGCAAVQAFDPHTAQLRHVFVAPPRRGLGAARSLTVRAIEFAREHGYARIVLDTNKAQLQPAYLLYRSLGFEECEPFATVTYECPTFMELRLD
ncbi:MAG TPA: GNAT family N-acetyltransferase [Candidatus Cybelea sp.]|nr:GNAT family N-acetyltransferase [Candidatus Cybelea sp.]